MPNALTPGARLGLRPCKCGHRAGLHDRYMCGPCRAVIGMGRAAKSCGCTQFTPVPPTTNPTPEKL